MSDEKRMAQVTTLGNHSGEDVTVNFEFDDRIEQLRMRVLSYSEVQEINRSVPDPIPPIVGVDGKKQPIRDLQDTNYQRAVEDAYQLRIFKCIVRSVRLDIPGKTEDEKIEFLKSLSANYVRLLTDAALTLMLEGDAKLEAKAAFPDGSGGKTR